MKKDMKTRAAVRKWYDSRKKVAEKAKEIFGDMPQTKSGLSDYLGVLPFAVKITMKQVIALKSMGISTERIKKGSTPNLDNRVTGILADWIDKHALLKNYQDSFDILKECPRQIDLARKLGVSRNRVNQIVLMFRREDKADSV